MITQVVFQTDSHLKKLAMEKLRNQGLTLKAFLNAALEKFTQGALKFDLRYEEPEIIEVPRSFQKKMDRMGRLLEKKIR